MKKGITNILKLITFSSICSILFIFIFFLLLRDSRPLSLNASIQLFFISLPFSFIIGFQIKDLLKFGKTNSINMVQIDTHDFDQNVLDIIKSDFPNFILRYYTNPSITNALPNKRLYIITKNSEEITAIEIKSLAKVLNRYGFQTVITKELSYEGILFSKINDIYQLIEEVGTEGANYDISTSQIVSQIKDWSNKYKVNVIQISSDNIELQFSNVDKLELNTLSQQLLELCPALKEFSTDPISDIKKTLTKRGVISLWWN